MAREGVTRLEQPLPFGTGDPDQAMIVDAARRDLHGLLGGAVERIVGPKDGADEFCAAKDDGFPIEHRDRRAPCGGAPLRDAGFDLAAEEFVVAGDVDDRTPGQRGLRRKVPDGLARGFGDVAGEHRDVEVGQFVGQAPIWPFLEMEVGEDEELG